MNIEILPEQEREDNLFLKEVINSRSGGFVSPLFSPTTQDIETEKRQYYLNVKLKEDLDFEKDKKETAQDIINNCEDVYK